MMQNSKDYPRQAPGKTERPSKDAPGYAPESGHGYEPQQTAQSGAIERRRGTVPKSGDDPGYAPESGDLE